MEPLTEKEIEVYMALPLPIRKIIDANFTGFAWVKSAFGFGNHLIFIPVKEYHSTSMHSTLAYGGYGSTMGTAMPMPSYYPSSSASTNAHAYVDLELNYKIPGYPEDMLNPFGLVASSHS